MSSEPLSIIPVTGLPEVKPGDDLTQLLVEAVTAHGPALADGDVVVVAQKVVSKAEGARIALSGVEPSPFAVAWARRWEREPRQVEVVLREARRIVRMERGLIIAETKHGYVCANAGVDLSNTGEEDVAILLPEDPDRSARQLREGIRHRLGCDVAVIVADTFGRPWRSGLVQVALGVAGLTTIIDYKGVPDADGRVMKSTEVCMADQLACAAELACGKTTNVPIAVIRGYTGPRGEGSGADMLRDPELDLFR